MNGLQKVITRYWFWLALVSLVVLVAERVAPWRKKQAMLRPLWLQDLFWLVFNGYLFGLLAGPILNQVLSSLAALTGEVTRYQLLAGKSWALQMMLLLVARDFLEWCVHVLLHGVPVLWRFHRVHHSIHTMDWIGNFRFHFAEIFVYQTLTYIPLAMLGVRGTPLLVAGVFSTLVGHLNHANLKLSYGPLRYLLNSPRMHIWHHEQQLRGRFGVNFGVVFSVWDWLFRTAYMPDDPPAQIGFDGDERFPEALWWRFFLPFLDRRSRAG